MQIFKTKEYSRFKILEANRKVCNNFVLEKSVKLRNDLHLFPIIVNKEMCVLDGQHRLAVAMKYNLEVAYIVDEEASIDDVRRWNSCSRTWSGKDFVDSFASEGKDTYICLKNLMERFSLHLSYLIAMLSSSSTGGYCWPSLRRGTFKLTETEKYYVEIIEKTNEIFDKISAGAPQKKSKNKYAALSQLIKLDGYDHSRMLRHIERFPEATVFAMKMGTTENIFKHLLDHVYNRGKGDKI